MKFSWQDALAWLGLGRSEQESGLRSPTRRVPSQVGAAAPVRSRPEAEPAARQGEPASAPAQQPAQQLLAAQQAAQQVPQPVTQSPGAQAPVPHPSATQQPGYPYPYGYGPPPIGGIEGVNYEVASTRRGPGTLGALAVLLAVALIGLWAVIRVYSSFSDRVDPPGEPYGQVIVTLPEGSSTSGISQLLSERGVIPDATAYEWFVRLRGGPAFQAGDYEFQRNSSVEEALAVLERGPFRASQALAVRMTFPEGLTVAEMANRIDATDGIGFTGNDFLAALRANPPSPDLAPVPAVLHPQTIEPAEGLLAGDTYHLDGGSTAAQLVELMVRQTDRVLSALDFGAVEHPLGLSGYELLIVASIIEREAKLPEDRPRVARVVYNRLAADWTLGMDVTISYAVHGAPLDASALEIDSPYNTRLYKGLPPTPIASPSIAALQAALEPDDGDWMFFVQTSRLGKLSFSENIEEFQQDVELCRQLELCG